MNFVTLIQAKAHIYLDHDDDDNLVKGYIAAASSAVKNYLKSASPFEVERDSNFNPVLDSNCDPTYVRDSAGDKIIMDVVQQATLLLIGYFYKNRDEDLKQEYQSGYLPAPVCTMLYPLRTPTVA